MRYDCDPEDEYSDWIDTEVYRLREAMARAVQRGEGGCLEPFTDAILEAVKDEDFLADASEWLACEDAEERRILGQGVMLLLADLAEQAIQRRLEAEAEKAYERRHHDDEMDDSWYSRGDD